MLQIALCDDNTNDLSTMIHLLDEYKSSKQRIELTSALDKGKQFDIYCLDIMMPGFTGIDLANEIRGSDKTAPILFFTSSAEFALESYSVRAADYVLKPVSKENSF